MTKEKKYVVLLQYWSKVNSSMRVIGSLNTAFSDYFFLVLLRMHVYSEDKFRIFLSAYFIIRFFWAKIFSSGKPNRYVCLDLYLSLFISLAVFVYGMYSYLVVCPSACLTVYS